MVVKHEKRQKYQKLSLKTFLRRYLIKKTGVLNRHRAVGAKTALRDEAMFMKTEFLTTGDTRKPSPRRG